LFELLDDLLDISPDAFELLSALIEQYIGTDQGQDHQNYVLLAIPVLMWNRSVLPTANIDNSSLKDLSSAFHTTWLTDDTNIYISPTLYNHDNLPDNFSGMRHITLKHFHAAKAYHNHQAINLHSPIVLNAADTTLLTRPKAKSPKQTTSANEALTHHTHYQQECAIDTCFIMVVISAPIDKPMLKINPESDIEMNKAQEQWKHLAVKALAPALIGCAYEVLEPESFYAAQRSASFEIRAFSLNATVLMLMSSLEVKADDLKVVIVGCYESDFEEYRISFLLKSDEQGRVLQGVIWPLLAFDETQETLFKEICDLLHDLGIKRIKLIEDSMPLEYCDDCDAPLFPNLEADMVHTGLDEDNNDPFHQRTVH
jgi:hypothetical protein